MPRILNSVISQQIGLVILCLISTFLFEIWQKIKNLKVSKHYSSYKSAECTLKSTY